MSAGKQFRTMMNEIGMPEKFRLLDQADGDAFLTVDLVKATATTLKLCATVALDGCPESAAPPLAAMCRALAEQLDKFLENRE